jgi:N-acetylmuramoyl-L-alanine amidase
MSIGKHHIFTILFTLCCLLFNSTNLAGKDFTLVIDPGHGGHDAGAIGSFSKEKNINLTIALKVGQLIKQSCSDVKVVFTRTTDVFIPLNERAEIANHANANLFISIHTNSMPKGSRSTEGIETYSLGLARSEANLAVAKRENSVILLEKDYKKQYAGFDPNSSESYIIFEFMQDKNMKQSVHLATLVQQQIRTFGHRKDKGVKQAGFLVLRATAMPSVLVEVGFISNTEEEQYLNSEAGSNTIAESIFRAFMAYKQEDDRRQGRRNVPFRPVEEMEPILNDAQPEENQQPITNQAIASEKKQTEQNDSNQIIFKVQLFTSPVIIKENSPLLKGLTNMSYYSEKGVYKYTYGESEDFYETCRKRKEILLKFKDAFVIAFRGKERINITKAVSEFKKHRK